MSGVINLRIATLGGRRLDRNLEIILVGVTAVPRRVYNAALQAEMERVGPNGVIDLTRVELTADALLASGGSVFLVPQAGSSGTVGSGSRVWVSGRSSNLSKKPGKFGQFKGRDALRAENNVARDAAKEAGLNKDQARRLHDEISGQGFDYQEVLEIAKDIGGGK